MKSNFPTGKLSESQIEEQIENDNSEDELWQDENDFNYCDDCDCPDACEDFGCAIKHGIKRNLDF